jgi:hypothetical protein
MSAAGHLHAVPGFEQKTTHCFAKLAYQTEGSMKRGYPKITRPNTAIVTNRKY